MAKLSLKPLPPEEALAYFKAKGYRLEKTFDWRDKWQEDHATAFTVAKSAGFDVLQDIHGAIKDALANGTTFQQFRKQLEPTLKAKGWWGQKNMVDPLTGERKAVQLGSPRRLQIIHDVNIRQAQAAGHWARIQRSKRDRPYLAYTAVMDQRTRPEHAAWNGTTLHIDNPWWQTHYPPNGWRCRCSVIQMDKDDAADWGYKISDTAPPVETVSYTNKRTGETVRVPKGIDPGFGYNSGRAALDQNAAALFMQKLAPADPKLSAAAYAASAKFVVPALKEDFKAWAKAFYADTKSGAALTRGTRYPIAVLPPSVVAHYDEAGAALSNAAVSISDKELGHLRRGQKTKLGHDLTIDEIAALPDIFSARSTRFFRDTRDGSLIAVYRASKDRLVKLVIKTEFATKPPPLSGMPKQTEKVTLNALRSARTINEGDLHGHLVEIKR